MKNKPINNEFIAFFIYYMFYIFYIPKDNSFEMYYSVSKHCRKLKIKMFHL